MNLTKLGMYAGHAIKSVIGFYAYPFDKGWDKLLNRYLDDLGSGSTSFSVSFATLRFEDKEDSAAESEVRVWIENKYYAFGHLYSKGDSDIPNKLKYRPSIHTMIRLQEFLDKEEKEDVKWKYKDIYG